MMAVTLFSVSSLLPVTDPVPELFFFLGVVMM